MGDDEQQVQPGTLEQGADGSTSQAEANQQGTAESTYQRVTPEEAATLPYAELKRRMKEEARLHAEGLLPTSGQATAGEEGTGEQEDEAGTSSREHAAETAGTSGGETRSGAAPQEQNLQELLRQAQERAAQLERERADERQQAERAQMQANHQRVEEAISRLPEQQQPLARQDYMNRLGQQALNEYHSFLQTREQNVRQAEIAQARTQIPQLLSELADSVAQRHGLRNADTLKAYVTSAEFRALLDASGTEEALTAAAANAGQWMEFLAGQQAAQNAQRLETRRQNAANANKVVRDTPPSGVPVAGGDMDAVNRINNMSREEFFAWKKQQLQAAAQR